MKPIDMKEHEVKAILGGSKTMFRRVIKKLDEKHLCNCGAPFYSDGELGCYYCSVCGSTLLAHITKFFRQPYQPDDVLYVRESFSPFCRRKDTCSNSLLMHSDYCYNATFENDCCEESDSCKWQPSIRMPKEAARLFLRIVNVRAERLHSIPLEDVYKEGFNPAEYDERENYYAMYNLMRDFANVWDDTIRKDDREKYDWAANPYVYVVEFKVISKEEAMK